MDLDQLLRHYLRVDDPEGADDTAVAHALERVRIDFGTEGDPGRRFALWTLLDAFGDAPPPAEAFRDHPELRDAADRYLKTAWRMERDAEA